MNIWSYHITYHKLECQLCARIASVSLNKEILRIVMVKKSFMEVTVGLRFEDSDFGRQMGGKTCQTDD